MKLFGKRKNRLKDIKDTIPGDLPSDWTKERYLGMKVGTVGGGGAYEVFLNNNKENWSILEEFSVYLMSVSNATNQEAKKSKRQATEYIQRSYGNEEKMLRALAKHIDFKEMYELIVANKAKLSGGERDRVSEALNKIAAIYNSKNPDESLESLSFEETTKVDAEKKTKLQLVADVIKETDETESEYIKSLSELCDFFNFEENNELSVLGFKKEDVDSYREALSEIHEFHERYMNKEKKHCDIHGMISNMDTSILQKYKIASTFSRKYAKQLSNMRLDDGLSWQAHTVKPFQRIGKYPLLMREWRKHATPDEIEKISKSEDEAAERVETLDKLFIEGTASAESSLSEDGSESNSPELTDYRETNVETCITLFNAITTVGFKHHSASSLANLYKKLKDSEGQNPDDRNVLAKKFMEEFNKKFKFKLYLISKGDDKDKESFRIASNNIAMKLLDLNVEPEKVKEILKKLRDSYEIEKVKTRDVLKELNETLTEAKGKKKHGSDVYDDIASSLTQSMELHKMERSWSSVAETSRVIEQQLSRSSKKKAKGGTRSRDSASSSGNRHESGKGVPRRRSGSSSGAARSRSGPSGSSSSSSSHSGGHNNERRENNRDLTNEFKKKHRKAERQKKDRQQASARSFASSSGNRHESGTGGVPRRRSGSAPGISSISNGYDSVIAQMHEQQGKANSRARSKKRPVETSPLRRR
jgi:hypothetical protein